MPSTIYTPLVSALMDQLTWHGTYLAPSPQSSTRSAFPRARTVAILTVDGATIVMGVLPDPSTALITTAVSPAPPACSPSCKERP